MPCISKDEENATCKHICICSKCPYDTEMCNHSQVYNEDGKCINCITDTVCYYVEYSFMYWHYGKNFRLEENTIVQVEVE
jgi:hypothetical protein